MEHGGTACEGEPSQTRECNERECPVDGYWSDWTEWSPCSVTCETGDQSRSRDCTEPLHGGVSCQGDSEQTQPCVEIACPVDGIWGEWSLWSECSLTCGQGGLQNRTRVCDGPYHNGEDCQGVPFEQTDCFIVECPVDGVLQPWADWEACSMTCGPGTRSRSRICTSALHGGVSCDDEILEETEDCEIMPCPVNGEWTMWSVWGDCDSICGGGEQSRTRECVGQDHGGDPCPGEAEEFMACNEHLCPVDGVWSEWSGWGVCDVECDYGLQHRNRTCEGIVGTGLPCEGEEADTKECRILNCRPGDWTLWSDWSLCSQTCQVTDPDGETHGGTRMRSRECDMTSHGELTAECTGDSNELEACHNITCWPYASTCGEWYDRGFQDSDVEIQLSYAAVDRIVVKCDFSNSDGLGIATIVEHDFEENFRVHGYEGSGDFQKVLLYGDNDFFDLWSLVDVSEHCRQYVSWNCTNAQIMQMFGGELGAMTYWTDRSDIQQLNWAGASAGYKGCPCGETGTCGNDGDTTLRCNCDSRDGEQHIDAGYITQTDKLPIRSFRAGDTGATDIHEVGYATIGPLECYGQVDPV